MATTSTKPNWRVQVEIDLVGPADEEAVDDLVHQVWGYGDPSDLTKATIVVKDIESLPKS